MSEVENSIDAPAPHVAAAMLVAALKKARWITFWERLWPPLAAVATAIGLFLAVSWAGAWLWLPPIGRAIALFVFLVLTAAATVPLIFVRPPSPMSWRPRRTIRGRWRCGAPMWSARCWRPGPSRRDGRRRASTSAIPWPCEPWC